MLIIEDSNKRNRPFISKSRILGGSPDEMRHFKVVMPHFIKVVFIYSILNVRYSQLLI